MGRELKRVPLSFDWPLKIVWKGYLCPYQPIDCKLCGGNGENPKIKGELCKICGGDGYYWCDQKYKKLRENWQKIEPPKGDGYQLWETTSEGSPSSPVFDSLNKLCKWAEKNATTFSDFKATFDEWKKMLLTNNVCHKEGNIIFL